MSVRSVAGGLALCAVSVVACGRNRDAGEGGDSDPPPDRVAVAASATLAGTWRGGRTRYLACVVLAGIVTLSIPAGKRPTYVMPLLPAAAAVIGAWLSRVGSMRGGRFDRATLAAVLTGIAASAAAPVSVLPATGSHRVRTWTRRTPPPTLPRRAARASARTSRPGSSS